MDDLGLKLAESTANVLLEKVLQLRAQATEIALRVKEAEGLLKQELEKVGTARAHGRLADLVTRHTYQVNQGMVEGLGRGMPRRSSTGLGTSAIAPGRGTPMW